MSSSCRSSCRSLLVGRGLPPPAYTYPRAWCVWAPVRPLHTAGQASLGAWDASRWQCWQLDVHVYQR
eukprot:scaffold879_cov410-Prasinococcus_capsulatus_cf.AAC.25